MFMRSQRTTGLTGCTAASELLSERQQWAVPVMWGAADHADAALHPAAGLSPLFPMLRGL